MRRPYVHYRSIGHRTWFCEKPWNWIARALPSAPLGERVAECRRRVSAVKHAGRRQRSREACLVALEAFERSSIEIRPGAQTDSRVTSTSQWSVVEISGADTSRWIPSGTDRDVICHTLTQLLQLRLALASALLWLAETRCCSVILMSSSVYTSKLWQVYATDRLWS